MRWLLLFTLLFASPAFSATYYVSSGIGADTNNGTAKGTPWANAPGMANCASTCSSTTINVGDQIILRGGDTWTNTSFPLAMKTGSMGNVTYYGVDVTWFAGGSFAQPKFDMLLNVVSVTSSSMIEINNYDKLDDIEIVHFQAPQSATSPADCTTYVVICGKNTGNWEIARMNIHAWDYGGSGGYDPVMVQGDSHIPNGNTNSSFHDSVCNGGDATPNPGISGYCAFQGPPIVYNNTFENFANFILNAPTSVHDNLIMNLGRDFYSGAHGNCFEDNGDQGLNFYNNVLAHCDLNLTGSAAPAGVTLWIAPNATYTANVWNNVIFDTTPGNVLDLSHSVPNNSCPTTGGYCTAAGTFNFYNNTVECGPDSSPTQTCGGQPTSADAVLIENTHFITSTTAITPCAAGCTLTTNLTQTKATANGQGYTASQTYAFSPTTGGSTIGAGTNLTSTCSGALISLCSDTTYGNTRVAVARPNAAFDIGAYEYAGSPAAQGVHFGMLP